jgi:hypothetical protein
MAPYLEYIASNASAGTLLQLGIPLDAGMRYPGTLSPAFATGPTARAGNGVLGTFLGVVEGLLRTRSEGPRRRPRMAGLVAIYSAPLPRGINVGPRGALE